MHFSYKHLLQLLNIDWDFLPVSTLDGAGFVRCIQKHFLKQVDDSTGEGGYIKPGNMGGEVTTISRGGRGHFGNHDHNCLSCNIFTDKD